MTQYKTFNIGFVILIRGNMVIWRLISGTLLYQAKDKYHYPILEENNIKPIFIILGVISFIELALMHFMIDQWHIHLIVFGVEFLSYISLVYFYAQFKESSIVIEDEGLNIRFGMSFNQQISWEKIKSFDKDFRSNMPDRDTMSPFSKDAKKHLILVLPGQDPNISLRCEIEENPKTIYLCILRLDDFVETIESQKGFKIGKDIK